MAEDKDVKRGVKDLEQEITCPVCHEHYTDPKVLPCCHYYCKQCIHHIALRTGTDKPFPCPECRKDTTLPEASVDNLPTAFFVNRMKEVHSKLELAHGKVEAKCEICREDKAEAFCRQCTKFICAECVKQHQRMKISFPSHKISTLDDLKEGGAEEITIQEPSHETCKAHDQQINMYCYDCNILICRDCTIKDHRDHNYEFVKKAAPETRKMLLQQLDPIEEIQMSRSHAVKEIQSTISDLEEQGDSVADSIKSWGDKMHAIIDTHQQELLAEAAARVQQKVKHLSDQEEGISIAYTSSQGVIEYTKQCLEHSTNGEVMFMHAEIQSRIDKDIQSEENLEPMEEVDVGLEVEMSCEEDLRQLCHTRAKISRLPIEHVISGEGVKYAEVGRLSEFRVVTQLSNGKPTKHPSIVEGYLRSVVFDSPAIDSTIRCTVHQIGVNDYRIQYMPTVRGCHKLIVTVNGQDVAGSPFPVLVSACPTLLGEPVRIIRVNDPRYMAVTPTRNIIVTQMNNISVFDSDGAKLKVSIRSTLNDPYGVAVDSTDGCIFITDNTSNNYSRIIKLSPDFKQKQVLNNNSALQYRDLTVVGAEVMVGCRDKNVMVYTKELKYVRKIGSHGDGPGQFGSIVGISSDNHSNLYVSDSVKSCIHVFNNGGDYLDLLSHKSLSHPSCLCVFGHFMYVANSGCHCVSVFSTKGLFVTSFGSKGSSDGRFQCPIGVCVDTDGFVYVCDYGNRIQVF